MSQQINLFDARFRRQKQHFSAATLALALVAVLALSVAVQQLYAWQNRSLESALAQADARVAQLREQVVSFARQFGGGSTALGDEMARLDEALRARRGLLSSMQAGAGSAQGFSPYLASLARRTTHGVWLTGIDISDSMVIRGRALDGELVPAYIRQLNREEVFAGRAVSELRMSAKPEKHLEFTFSIPLAKDPS